MRGTYGIAGSNLNIAHSFDHCNVILVRASKKNHLIKINPHFEPIHHFYQLLAHKNSILIKKTVNNL